MEIGHKGLEKKNEREGGRERGREGGREEGEVTKQPRKRNGLNHVKSREHRRHHLIQNSVPNALEIPHSITKQEALLSISSAGQQAYTEYSSFSGPPKGE